MDRSTLLGFWMRGQDNGRWIWLRNVGIAMKCMPCNLRSDTDFSIATVMEELDRARKRADETVARGRCESFVKGGVDKEESNEVPSIFVCPILQDVMKTHM
ncbi:hypothetical protein GH714_042327 [Hevea brasiliensis]|uniref:Uncharacterized protein n=1 Tax=Hevea brasiliensis TaxID=3981 RepID=A0A6A6KA71_HEVBR|nr:hypothetical protein GH714_042327 [Hevea brasiliensis]